MSEVRLAVMVMFLVVVAVLFPCVGRAQELGEKALFTKIVEGRFVSNEDIPIGIIAGNPQCPAWLEVTQIRFETAYGNCWKPVVELKWRASRSASWRITVELLDRQGRVLEHSRDEPTVFITVQGTVGPKPYRAELELDPMHFVGRFQAQRFRLSLECLELDIEEGDRQSMDVSITDDTTKKPLTQAVIVQQSTQSKTWTRIKRLFGAGADGHIRIDALEDPSTSESLDVQCPGYTMITKGFGTEALPSTYEISLPLAKKIGGTVYNPSGQGVCDVWITVSASRQMESGQCYMYRAVKTDSKGQWEFEGIPQGVERIQVEFKHPSYKSVTRHFGSEQIEKTETLSPGLPVDGVVKDHRDHPVSDAVVHMLPMRYGRYDDNYMHVVTDDRGRFSFGCGRDDFSEDQSDKGLTLLLVEASGFIPAIKKVKLTNENPSVDIILESGQTITGKVVDEKGRPVPEAWIVAHPFPQEYGQYGMLQSDSDGQGQFILDPMPEQLRLTVGGQGFITVRDLPFPPQNGEPIVELTPEIRLTGKVADAVTGKAIETFELAINTFSQNRSTAPPRHVRWRAFTEGTYELVLDEIFQGERVLTVRANGYKPESSKPFTMDRGGREHDFALTPDSSYKIPQPERQEKLVVKGVVVDPNGQPASGVTLHAYGRFADDVVSASDGTFKLVFFPISGGHDEPSIIVARDKEKNLATLIPSFDPSKPLEIKLEEGVTLVGKVQDPNGRGLQQAEIVLRLWISDMGYGHREAVTIDEDGSFVIPAVPRRQRWSVDFKAAGYGSDYIRMDEYGHSSPIALEPMVLHVANQSIAGVVVDEHGEPIPGIQISAYGKGQPSLRTQCDEQGRFTLEGLVPGTVSLQANSRQGPRFYGGLRAQAGDRDIRIVAEQRDEQGRRISPQPKPLIGKPLPNWEDLGGLLDSNKLESKSVLLCFWDMQQRPSRRLITQLGAKTQELNKQNCTVVLVQMTKVEREELNQWLVDNEISFTSAMPEGDLQKKKFDWGVKSLPWLVLADKKHVVRAEGFNIQDLEDQLGQIGTGM